MITPVRERDVYIAVVPPSRVGAGASGADANYMIELVCARACVRANVVV